ncbi:hypothetical protein HC723_11780 [Vibrio sp. S11_S32]|uniref:hypothetical protein n=1 Tax=Vibrio sp. S11_S32 TaxID=2720225 RepID=UPI0016817D5F|nr:hypothetical protein [Vibrio sp. S11_S32]MBD1577112.1 hypothetical protein [Vibrio sp. S11_S32]
MTQQICKYLEPDRYEWSGELHSEITSKIKAILVSESNLDYLADYMFEVMFVAINSTQSIPDKLEALNEQLSKKVTNAE